MGIEQLFFELLQVAVGNRRSLSRVPTATEWGELYNMATRQALTGVCFVGLQRLSNDNTSHSTSSGQAVSSAQAHNATANLPELLRLKWLGIAAKIQQRNQMMNEECVAVTKQLVHDGLACCILKGQGNLVNYPEELREARNPGDIDVWCWPQVDSLSTSSWQAVSSPTECGIEIAVSNLDGKGAHYEHYSGARGVIEYALMQARVAGNPVPEVRYNHVELPRCGRRI